MHYIQALISVCLFGWLGYSVALGQLPENDGGSSKTRTLMSIVEPLTDAIGQGLTGALLFSVGVILAYFFLKRGSA
ncbi:MAG: hypothetical protein HKN18_06210 [Silicimonas sp.]|nr:hypothetical protein [Silicimonas sp.]